MRAALVCTWIALVACTKGEPRKQEPDPVPVPAPVTPKTAERSLLVEGKLEGTRSVRYLAVRFSADPAAAPTLVDLGEHPALSTRHGSIAAQDGTRWAYAVAGDSLLVGAMAPGKPTVRIGVPVEPQALHLIGDALYVGSDQAVGWIDLAIAKPTYVELVKREGYSGKAYDRFARDGARLLAIDDEVMPMYADWFALDPSGRPTKRLGDWSLPGVINGHYDHASLFATGRDEWTLVLAAPYGIRSGHGHNLAAIPIRGDKLVFEQGLTLQNADGKTPIVEEHVDRNDGKAKLLAGAPYTEWSGMAIAHGARVVVLAAGKRGLMTLPIAFSPTTTTATLIDAGGEVTDVRDQAGAVLALVVIDARSHLAFLDAGATKIAARHPLPEGVRFDRFVK